MREWGAGLSFFDLLYVIVLILLSPLLALKLIFNARFRSDLVARMKAGENDGRLSDIDALPTDSRIWFHAASIGEIRLAIKLIHAWKPLDVSRSFFITTNTLQSRDLGQTETTVPVLIAPLDFSPVVRRFIQRVNPAHLVLVETEIWPNMIRIMADHGRIAIVNGRLSDRYFRRYLLGRRVLKTTISRFDRVLARDHTSAERFQKMGVPAERVILQGNLKFEIPLPPEPAFLETIRNTFIHKNKRFLFVAGSVQPEELTDILPAWRRLINHIPGFQMLLIPRHTDKKDEFASLLSQQGISFSFASAPTQGGADRDEKHIYIIDIMGVLKACYVLADVIFVGGSLCNRGGQNMIEAVGYQKPVCIGPYATNFKEEVELLSDVSGIHIVTSAADIVAFVRQCHDHPEVAAKMSKAGYEAIAAQADALSANVRKLTEIIGEHIKGNP